MTDRELVARALWDAFDYMLGPAPEVVAGVVCDALEAAGRLE